MPALAAFCDAVLAALDAHAPHLVAHITTAGVVVLATAPVDPDDVPAGSTAAESALWALRALASELGLAPGAANPTWRDRELFPTAVGSPAPGGAGACGGPARVVTAMRRPAVHPNGEAYDALEVPQWPGGAAAFAVGPRSGGCAAAGSSATGGAAADATAWSTDVEQPLLRRTDGTVHGPVLVTLTAASGSGSVASGSAGTAGSPETVEFWFDGHWLWLYGCQFGDCAGDPGRGPGASWVFRVSRGGGCDDYEVTAVVEVTRAPSGAVTAAAVLGARVGGSPAPAAGTEPAPSPAVAAARRLRAAVAEAEAEPAAAAEPAADVIVLDSDSDPEPDDLTVRGYFHGVIASLEVYGGAEVTIRDIAETSSGEPFFVKHCGLPAAEATHLWRAVLAACSAKRRADAEGEAPPAKRPASGASDTPTSSLATTSSDDEELRPCVRFRGGDDD
jgi:hypothetical protein